MKETNDPFQKDILKRKIGSMENRIKAKAAKEREQAGRGTAHVGVEAQKVRIDQYLHRLGNRCIAILEDDIGVGAVRK